MSLHILFFVLFAARSQLQKSQFPLFNARRLRGAPSERVEHWLRSRDLILENACEFVQS
jgi:hypothetical protein